MHIFLSAIPQCASTLNVLTRPFKNQITGPRMKIIMCPFTLVLLIGLILPCATGLRCYQCFSEKKFENYHEDCEEGDLPDSVGVDCDWTNLHNPDTLLPLTPGEIEFKQNQFQNMTQIPWMCSKSQGKFGGMDLTKKGCDVNNYGENVERCVSTSGNGWSSANLCNCFNNLCNGSGSPWLSFVSFSLAIIAICLV